MSQMSAFINAAKTDTVQRDKERSKRSSLPPQGTHRLATNFDIETMKLMDDLRFTRRVNTYKELLTSLVEEAYREEVGHDD